MQRKRNELVPIGEVFSDLDNGPLKPLRATSPQALHHFTQADQVNQLVSASEADPDMGFMERLMALCSLPRTNQGDRLQYVRRNGPYTLVMTATGLHKLPYGTMPRLLLAWVCTEAVRTQSRELYLGDSFAAFMRKLEIFNDGGAVRSRLQNQMRRLFDAHVQLVYKDELGERFFHEVVTHPVPLDLNILKKLKRSPLGIDLYLWLVYRTFGLTHPKRLTWAQLYRQFGVDPAKANDAHTVDYFRTDCLRELTKLKTAWPDLNCRTVKGARRRLALAAAHRADAAPSQGIAAMA